MAVRSISLRLTNHGGQQHPSFHFMLITSLLKTVPIGKEAQSV